MQFYLGAVVAFGASFVAAQDASQLPQCSLPCFIQYVPETGCQLTDYTCQCTTEHQNQIRDQITSCVTQQCTDQQDQLNTLSTTNAICAKYGPSGGSSNSTSGGASGSSTTSSSSSMKMGPQATYFTAAAQPLQTAGAMGAAALGAAAFALL